MGLREQKKAEVRRELFDAARTSFRERGYEATRIRDVVDSIGVSEATFYNYFPTKVSVLQALADENKQLYAALLRHELANETAPMEKRVRELLQVVGQALSG